MTVPPASTSLPPTATPLPTYTPESTSCDEVGENCLEFTFNSENCIYEGPDFLKTNRVTTIFLNESEGNAKGGLLRHTGGETIQELNDCIGEGQR
jgi:hypothetical protein